MKRRKCRDFERLEPKLLLVGDLIFIQQQSGSFPRDEYTYARSVIPMDMDDDGDLDLVQTQDESFGRTHIKWYENQNQHFAVEHPIASIRKAPEQAAEFNTSVTDVDSDGDLDVILGRSTSGLVLPGDVLEYHYAAYWIENQGPGAEWSVHEFTDLYSRTEDMIVDNVPPPYNQNNLFGTPDLNGDGHLDIVSAGWGQRDLKFLLNNGQGEFNLARNIRLPYQRGYNTLRSGDILGQSGDEILYIAHDRSAIIGYSYESASQFKIDLEVDATDIHLTDVDGDSDQDIVTNALWIEMQQGEVKEIHRLFDEPLGRGTRILSGDLDRDGDTDLVYDNMAVWFENTNGLGNFEQHLVQLETAERSESPYVLADIDGNRAPDAIRELSWWQNVTAEDFNEDAALDANDIDQLCRQMGNHDNSRADVNGDSLVNQLDLDALVQDILDTVAGDADLNGVFDTSDLVHLFQKGEYENGRTANSTWSTGDWNCDQEFDTTDLVDAFQDGGFRKSLTPAFTLAATVHTQSPVRRMFPGDVDNDGHDDLIIGSSTETSWISIRDGIFGSRELINQWMRPFAAADLDGDGDLDIIGYEDLTRRVKWLENVTEAGGQVSFKLRWVAKLDFGDPHQIEVGDLDSDGDVDILVQPGIRWYENQNGDGISWVEHVLDSSGHAAELGDFDSDGHLDVLVLDENRSGSVFWYRNEGGGSFERTSDPIGPVHQDIITPSRFFATDLNGNAHIDIIWGRQWIEGLVDNLDDYHTHSFWTAAFDFDADRDIDLLDWRSGFRQPTILYLERNDGRGAFREPIAVAQASFEEIGYYVFVDVEGDGDLDALVASNVGQIELHLSDLDQLLRI